MAENRDLNTFVRDALSKGSSRAEVSDALTQAGWSAEDIAAALRGYAEIDFPIPVPRPLPSLSARDAFQYVVLFGTLYISAFNLGQLLYQLINVALPDSTWSEAQVNAIPDLIRWSIAALVVSTPIFVYTARANAAAVMPPTPAQPGCMRLVQAPSARNSMLADAVLRATPWAIASCPALQPKRRPAMSAQAKAPTSPVGWKPLWWNPPLAAMAMRAPVSTPIT